jgi:hypothetical protein
MSKINKATGMVTAKGARNDRRRSKEIRCTGSKIHGDVVGGKLINLPPQKLI